MSRRLTMAALATTALLAGCSDMTASDPAPDAAASTEPTRSDATGPEGTIAIAGFVFAPKTVRMASGTTVTWRNDDDAVHSVVAADRTTFASGLLEKGQDFTFTPTAAGTVDYICGVHQYMTGTLVVE